MELMNGGDVFDRILSLQRYTEKDARDLVRFLLETVNVIHSKGIAHRDLKPQNLLLKVGVFAPLFDSSSFTALTCVRSWNLFSPRRIMQTSKLQISVLLAVCTPHNL